MDRVRRGGEPKGTRLSSTHGYILDVVHGFILRNGDGRLYVGMTGFFSNDTATTEIYTLSLHDALPISWTLLHVETYDQKASALRREKFFKTGAGREERDRIVAALNG